MTTEVIIIKEEVVEVQGEMQALPEEGGQERNLTNGISNAIIATNGDTLLMSVMPRKILGMMNQILHKEMMRILIW